MIKTIIESSIEELDKKTNSFIKNKKILGIIPGQMCDTQNHNNSQTCHKVTICYEEYQEDIQQQHSTNNDTETRKPKIKIGALWRNEFGTIKGKINNQNLEVKEQHEEKFKQDIFQIKIKGIECIIEKNTNKIQPKQPDWIIYQK